MNNKRQKINADQTTAYMILRLMHHAILLRGMKPCHVLTLSAVLASSLKDKMEAIKPISEWTFPEFRKEYPTTNGMSEEDTVYWSSVALAFAQAEIENTKKINDEFKKDALKMVADMEKKKEKLSKISSAAAAKAQKEIFELNRKIEESKKIQTSLQEKSKSKLSDSQLERKDLADLIQASKTKKMESIPLKDLKGKGELFFGFASQCSSQYLTADQFVELMGGSTIKSNLEPDFTKLSKQTRENLPPSFLKSCLGSTKCKRSLSNLMRRDLMQDFSTQFENLELVEDFLDEMSFTNKFPVQFFKTAIKSSKFKVTKMTLRDINKKAFDDESFCEALIKQLDGVKLSRFDLVTETFRKAYEAQALDSSVKDKKIDINDMLQNPKLCSHLSELPKSFFDTEKLFKVKECVENIDPAVFKGKFSDSNSYWYQYLSYEQLAELMEFDGEKFGVSNFSTFSLSKIYVTNSQST